MIFQTYLVMLQWWFCCLCNSWLASFYFDRWFLKPGTDCNSSFLPCYTRILVYLHMNIHWLHQRFLYPKTFDVNFLALTTYIGRLIPFCSILFLILVSILRSNSRNWSSSNCNLELWVFFTPRRSLVKLCKLYCLTCAQLNVSEL